MSLSHPDRMDLPTSLAKRIVMGAVVLAALAMTARALPDLLRYLRIRRM